MNFYPHKRRAAFLIAFCPIAYLMTAAGLKGESGEDVEYPAKLAFLYNFAKFIEWPAGSYARPSAPFVICIAGRDPFSPDIETDLRTRAALGHPIEIRSLRVTDTSNACHMVFIPVTEKDQIDKILRGLKGSGTLTVSETEGFAARGGIINLTIEGNRLRFEINKLAAERAGLKISSKLFSLAKLVTDDPQRP